MSKTLYDTLSKDLKALMNLPQVMLDNETLGTASDAPIIAIGATVFTFADGALAEDSIYLPIKLQSAIDSGAMPSGSTISWWMEQSDDARAKFYEQPQKDALDMETALEAFASWFVATSKSYKAGYSRMPIWGNGPTFDCGMLAATYERMGIATPWRFFQERCVRTLRQQGDAIGMDKGLFPFEGTPHYALDDAIHQANHVAAIQRRLLIGE